MKLCDYPDCQTLAWATGLCHRHYKWKKYGKPANPRGRQLSPIERFARKFTIDPEGGCWEWTDWLNDAGYGLFWIGDNSWAAHRWSYEWHVGAIPSGLTLDHLCYNPRCVNPDHLEPCTRRENTLRAWDHRRQKAHRAFDMRNGPLTD